MILEKVSLWLWVTTLVAKSMGKSWWIGECISLKHVIPLLKIRLTAKAATVGFRIRTMVLHPWGGPCTLQWRLRQLEILKGSRGKRNPWNQSAQTYKPISSKNSAGILCLIRCMSLAAKNLPVLRLRNCLNEVHIIFSDTLTGVNPIQSLWLHFPNPKDV